MGLRKIEGISDSINFLLNETRNIKLRKFHRSKQLKESEDTTKINSSEQSCVY
jgi:hypothetical protein